MGPTHAAHNNRRANAQRSTPDVNRITLSSHLAVPVHLQHVVRVDLPENQIFLGNLGLRPTRTQHGQSSDQLFA